MLGSVAHLVFAAAVQDDYYDDDDDDDNNNAARTEGRLVQGLSCGAQEEGCGTVWIHIRLQSILQVLLQESPPKTCGS